MKKLFLLVLLIAFGFKAVQAQDLVIKGKVTDNGTGNPLDNVSVVLADTKKGVSTDKDGNFSITTTSKKSVSLVFSYVGYSSQTVAADGKNPLRINLVKSDKGLDDVVVIGYQTVRRKDLTGSVSSVGARELKDIPINSAVEALNGRLAGVTATTAEGSPDAEVRVRIRGGMSITQDNSPLYIVDGVQVENGLATIAPQNIQSIDVLKDAASTAIYGARGANGVIVITTKSGRQGKLQLSYNGFVGVKQLSKKLDVLKPYDFVEYAYERSRGDNADSISFRNNFGTNWDTLNVYKNVDVVDWQGEVFGKTGIFSNNNVSVNGGNKSTTYNFGYTNNYDKAIVLNSKYQRNLLNLKVDQNIAKGLKLGVSARYTDQNVLGAGVSDDRGTSYNRLRNAIKYRPFLSSNQNIDDGDPFADAGAGNGLVLTNPIQLANSEYRKKSTDAYNITANLNYTIGKGFSFRSTLGYDHNELIDKAFSDSITPYATTQGDKKPIISLDTAKTKIITNSNVLSYSLKNFKNKHNLDIIVGEETYQLEGENYGRTLKGYDRFTPAGKTFELASGGVGTVVGLPRLYKSKYTSLSFFSRVNYSFLDKYIFSFNFRADGASKFGPENKWGYFPGGSIAWRVKKEKFLKDVDFINDLKLRASVGTVGNNRITDYLFLTTFRNDQFFYGFNGQLSNAYSSTSLVNENLKWESAVNRNYGLDITLWKNRIDLSVDYYNNDSKSLLLDVPVASTYGYATQLQNIGRTSAKGIEFQLNAALLRKKNFSWNANFNISFGKNKVEALGINQQSFFPGASWGVSGQPTDYIVKIGAPVGSMWGWVNDGFYTADDFNHDAATGMYTLKTGVADIYKITGGSFPGSIKFKDLSGPGGVPDGVVDDFDKTIIGNPTPKFTGGLNQQFTYKNWDASLFVNFSYGNDIYNANKIEMTNAYTENANLLEMMAGRWKTIDGNGNVLQTFRNLSVAGGPIKTYAFSTAPAQLAAVNANATIWQPIRAAGAFYPNSWAIEDGSFLRLNNITLGYTLPVKSLLKMKISKLRFYGTANNVAVFTGYSGYDPEVSVRRSPLTPGLDYSAYPKSRTFLLGVNVIF